MREELQELKAAHRRALVAARVGERSLRRVLKLEQRCRRGEARAEAAERRLRAALQARQSAEHDAHRLRARLEDRGSREGALLRELEVSQAALEQLRRELRRGDLVGRVLRSRAGAPDGAPLRLPSEEEVRRRAAREALEDVFPAMTRAVLGGARRLAADFEVSA